jgi:DNA-binding MarR family transcriptional regulator/GNAT superfamily N-acetyltransferase
MVDEALIAGVRSFNRTVTQRVGALQDHYLSRDRPLGEARVLWEIGDGCDVRTLRSRLDLDSGYLSRLLRSLEGDGLISVGPGTGDRRIRSAVLTAIGRKERALLDRRSDALAADLLEPLSPAQRDRLVAAMGEVERLLTAALVTIEPVDPADPRAQHCLREYFAELDRRFEGGFDPAQTLSTDLEGMRPPNGTFLVATLRGAPVGSGALKFHEEGVGELKRMWVDPATRGLGVGRRLLASLELTASCAGCERVQLDTNPTLTEAIAMYRSAGYHPIEAFNEEPYAALWFEKSLVTASAGT